MEKSEKYVYILGIVTGLLYEKQFALNFFNVCNRTQLDKY